MIDLLLAWRIDLLLLGAVVVQLFLSMRLLSNAGRRDTGYADSMQRWIELLDRTKLPKAGSAQKGAR